MAMQHERGREVVSTSGRIQRVDDGRGYVVILVDRATGGALFAVALMTLGIPVLEHGGRLLWHMFPATPQEAGLLSSALGSRVQRVMMAQRVC